MEEKNKINLIVKTTGLVSRIAASYLNAGDFVLDCTLGNGHDTLFLASQVNASGGALHENAGGTGQGDDKENESPRGLVMAFDIQDPAIESASSLLRKNGIEPVLYTDENSDGILSTDGETAWIPDSGVLIIKSSHENIDKYVSAAGRKPSLIMFNLGFMPGKDKSVLTRVKTTVPTVKKAIELVETDGLVSVVCYTGHSEGRLEHEALREYLTSLPSKQYHVAYIDMVNQKKTAPSVFLITRKK